MVMLLVPARSAAPGVDQAVMIGRRCRTDRTALVPIIDRHRTLIHVAFCPSVAPTASAPASTMATEPPKPTRTAIKADRMTDMRKPRFLPTRYLHGWRAGAMPDRTSKCPCREI